MNKESAREFLRGVVEIRRLPKVWWGYVLLPLVIFSIAMGWTWIALFGVLLMFLDRVFMHYNFLMATAGGRALQAMHRAMVEYSALTHEVEHDQQEFMARKMRESEGE